MSKCLGSLIFLFFWSKLYILFSISCRIVHIWIVDFRIVHIWTMYQCLDNGWFINVFWLLKESPTLFQIWNFFIKLSVILFQLELLREEFTKITQVFWWAILTMPFVLAYQFYFYLSQGKYRAWLFEKFIF